MADLRYLASIAHFQEVYYLMLRSCLQTPEFAEGMLQRLDRELRASREVVELVDPLEAFELEDGADR
jgi:hypothetical protein